MKLLIHSGANIQILIIRMILLAVTNLSETEKILVMVTVIHGIKYSLLSTKVLGFIACRVNSKMLGIGSAEHSWVDVKTIKSGKISALGSDISEKQSIVYKYACIEETSIGRTLSHTDHKDGSHSHYCNDEDHTLDYKLYQWGFDKLFQNSDESITR